MNPAKMIRNVRQETARVTWPTRKETLMSTVMVIVMVCILAGFFMLTDGVIANLVELLLDL